MPSQNAAHTKLVNDIFAALGSHPDVRIFKNRTALAWAGESERLPNGDRIVHNPYPIHAGLTAEGSSDLVGVQRLRVHMWTPDEPVEVGRFFVIEVKTGKATATPEQNKFINMVNRFGGRGGVCRSIAEAFLLIGLPVPPEHVTTD